jgi:SnoaL-like domain
MVEAADRDELASRLAILQLEAEYARTWDSKDAAGWAACFTDDGAFEMSAVPGGLPAMRFAGRSELEQFCSMGTSVYEGIHLLSAPDLTITGHNARGWVHFSYFDRNLKTEEVRHVVGVYAVTYLRTDEGWKMALRHEQAVLTRVITDGAFYGFPDPRDLLGPGSETRR